MIRTVELFHESPRYFHTHLWEKTPPMPVKPLDSARFAAMMETLGD
jgi:hypothetical protein